MRLIDIIEAKIDEVSMSPGALSDYANTPFAQSMTAGFEAELIIPNVRGDEDSYESEPDYDMDERISGWDDIRDFFVGDYNTRRTVDRAIEEMQEEFFSDAGDVFSEEMQDEIIDYIRAAAKDDGMSQEEIDAMMEDPNDNSDYEKYQDNAREELENDFFENYFDTWIRRNYPRMSNVSQNLNLDWPYWTSPSEGAGELEINDVANQIEGAIGMRVKGSSGYHSAKRGNDYFILEPDSSIDSDESEGEAGLELVSPPMPLAQCLEYLDSVFKWANAYGCRTDSSTGFHMGISIPGQTMENVDHLKFTLFLGDEYVLKQFGRESNTYARSMYKRIRSDVQRSSDSMNPEAILNAFRKGMNTIAADTIKRLLTSNKDRYVTVNIKENYIEVRSAGGDYLGDLDKIKNTLLRYVRAMGLASDPEAEKQEYAKKLYKLLASTMQPGEEDVIKYFAQYSAGTLPAAALKSFIKQAQMKRAGKKDGAATNAALTATSVGGGTRGTPGAYRMTDNRGGYLSTITSDYLVVAYGIANARARAAGLAADSWKLFAPNGLQVYPEPSASSATTSSPASTAGTYVITYRSPIDGEQRTAIDANSASEAEEWFRSNHPSTYQIVNTAIA